MGNSPFGPLPWRSNTRGADRTVSYPKSPGPRGGGSGVLALVLGGPPGGGDGLELGAQPEYLLLDLDHPQLGDRGPLLGLDEPDLEVGGSTALGVALPGRRGGPALGLGEGLLELVERLLTVGEADADVVDVRRVLGRALVVEHVVGLGLGGP